LRDIRRDPEPLPEQLAVHGILPDQQVAAAGQNPVLVDGVEGVLVAVDATAEVVTVDPFVGRDGQHELYQLLLRNRDAIARVPAVCPGAEIRDRYVGDLHSVVSCRKTERAAYLSAPPARPAMNCSWAKT